MMKRKLFSLSPLKIPSSSKQENKALRESLERFSPPPSPFIDRRPLSPRTELHLRAACAAIVNGIKASEGAEKKKEFAPKEAPTLHVNAQTQGSSSRSKSRPRVETGPSQSANPNRPRNASASAQASSTAAFPKRYASLRVGPTMSQEVPINPLRMNTYPAQQVSIVPGKPRSVSDRPKTAGAADTSDSSVSTPLSSSTDGRFDYTSTALTSAGYTPSRGSNSKRESPNLTKDQAVIYSPADPIHSDEGRPSGRFQSFDLDRSGNQPAPSRASSRARRIGAEIKEYIRPTTSAGSRPVSRSSENKDPGFGGHRTQLSSNGNGWRSWGLSRRPSNANLKDGESRGRDTGAKDVNLNRELPPLPSLDQWKEPEVEVASIKAETINETASKSSTATHIANLMRPASRASRARRATDADETRSQRSAPTDDQKSTKSAGNNASKMRSKSIEALRYVQDKREKRSKSKRREDSMSPWASSMQCQGVDAKVQVDPFAIDDEAPPPRKSFSRSHTPAAREKECDTPKGRPSTSHRRDGSNTTRFDRKISLDMFRSQTPQVPHDITALPIVPEHDGRPRLGLKKVLSNFNLSGRKEKKTTTLFNEKTPITTAQIDAAMAPHARY